MNQGTANCKNEVAVNNFVSNICRYILLTIQVIVTVYGFSVSQLHFSRRLSSIFAGQLAVKPRRPAGQLVTN